MATRGAYQTWRANPRIISEAALRLRRQNTVYRLLDVALRGGYVGMAERRRRDWGVIIAAMGGDIARAEHARAQVTRR